MEVCPDVADLISTCIDGDALVRESASDDLRSARMTMNALSNRLKAMLRNHPGDVSEQVTFQLTCPFQLTMDCSC